MDGVHPRQTYNAGIKVVYNQITRQVGLSYLSGTVVLRAPFSFIPAGYFGQELAHPRCDDEEYFLAFESVLNRDPTPLTAVKKNALWDCNRLNSDAIQTLSSHASPIPALVANRGYGLIYTNDKSFIQHFGTSPVYSSVDMTYEPTRKRVTPSHVLFLSMKSILASPLMHGNKEWDPVELVPVCLTQVFLPGLSVTLDHNESTATTVFSSAPNSPLPMARPKSSSKTVTFADPVVTDFPSPTTGGDHNTEFPLALDIPFMAEYISFAIPHSKPPKAKRSALAFYSFSMKKESLKRPASTAACCTKEETKRRVDVQGSCARDSVCGNMMKNEV